MFQKFSFLAGLLALSLWLAAPAPAAQAFVVDDDGQIPAGTVVDDDVVISEDIVQVDGTINGALIATGQTIYINGVVNGDVVVNASDVFINGPVNGNIIFTGAALQINAPVSGSVFGAGYLLQLTEAARVQRNLVFAGYALDVQSGTAIGRDAIFAGAQAYLSGRVGGDVNANASGLTVNGTVDGDVNASVDDPTEPMAGGFSAPTTLPFRTMRSGLSVAPEARIGGNLNYTSPVAQADRIQAQPGGSVTHTTPVVDMDEAPMNPVLAWALAQLRELITLLLLGALAVWQLPAALSAASQPARTRFLPALGWGVVILVGGLVALTLIAMAVFITGVLFGVVTLGSLVGLVFGLGFSAFGLILSAFILLTSYGSKIVVAVAVGQWLLRRFAPSQGDNLGASMALGIVLYMPLASIPVLGAVFGLFISLLGLGAIGLAVRQHTTPPGAPNTPVMTVAEPAMQ